MPVSIPALVQLLPDTGNTRDGIRTAALVRYPVGTAVRGRLDDRCVPIDRGLSEGLLFSYRVTHQLPLRSLSDI